MNLLLLAAALPRVLIIGDSISMGYTPFLQKELASTVEVVRITENGGPTANGVAKLDSWLGASKWDVIHFNFGLHDLKRMEDGQPQVPLPAYENNLRLIVARLRQTGAKLIWASTTPVPEGKVSPPRIPADVPLYNEAAARVMRDNGVAINDLYAHALAELPQWQRPVNVHFTDAGSAALAAKAAASIREALSRSVLIVADEIPAMKLLAARWEAEAQARSTIVTQKEMPASLSSYDAVAVYIHGGISAATEQAALAYARSGGRLILIHHSISSGKRKNADWLPALGVTLPAGELAAGGYAYREGIDMDIVNLAPGHPVTSDGVPYTGETSYREGARLPSFHLRETEVYLNHVYSGPRTPLLGFVYEDAKSGQTFMQDSAGWMRPLDKGLVFYFMPGHSVRDFENPAYARILSNALLYTAR
jgi:acyl-CoA thioesterase-1